ncbi:flagellar hook-basal body protein [Halalkalibacter hemicellulosilyticus]|uniref:Flagellar basal-body rod protein FlgG n=1 Tax=Halalkalibacter hemicellulosilyticusJCM 9152 TaxID=1236971 RepID=W4QJ09_9BACI|nr:flagellar hook-basal body protein [Halalkalibacter hemicellulosilyticus]GAE31319.1 flagellar basal-body rod protein FlgG [Halalkalibacter hemicellulosilyticusJCM 9152]
MNTSMIAGAVTMGQLQKKIDTISNNVANVNTNGFKRREATFSDLLFQQVYNQTNLQMEGGRLTPDGIRVGSGARLAQTALRLEQGSLLTTERELDFALTERDLFFQIETVVGGEVTEQLTRDGAFYLTESVDNPGEWSIVTSDGSFVLSATGERLNVPENFQSLELAGNGMLVATLEDGTQQDIGQIGLTRVLKPQLLTATGDNRYVVPNLDELGFDEADVIEAAAITPQLVQQGVLEGSNVDLSNEMNELIQAQRHFQFNGQSISIADDMAGLINGIRR